MNNDNWHELIQKHLAGLANPEESAKLEQSLESDAKLRALYLDYANLDMALESSAKAETVLQEAQLLSERSPILKSDWFSWRPLTSAAAGIMIGVLTSSMVWAYSGLKIPHVSRIAIPLVDPGFEELVTPIPATVPRSLDSWNGDTSHVVASGGASVAPKEGRSMLKMQPVDDRHYSRLEQIVEVGHLVPAEAANSNRTRAVEFSASFFCEGAVDKSKMVLVVRAFSLSGDEIRGTTEDTTDLVTSMARKSFHIPPGSTNWQTGKVRMDLPPNTNTLVFAIAAFDLPETSSTASRYVDDIKATLLIPEQPTY